MKNIAIFASGRGSNAAKIVSYFENHDTIRIKLIVSNKASAGVLEMAKMNNIPSLIINRNYFYQSKIILKDLSAHAINFIVLAGFLWLIPPYLIQAFPRRIINIHPALLPKFGGKGMYGHHVHEAVKAAGEKESGITIHYVNEQYDEGENIFQTSVSISPNDTPSDIAKKVLQLEHQYFAPVIENILLGVNAE